LSEVHWNKLKNREKQLSKLKFSQNKVKIIAFLHEKSMTTLEM